MHTPELKKFFKQLTKNDCDRGSQQRFNFRTSLAVQEMEWVREFSALSRCSNGPNSVLGSVTAVVLRYKYRQLKYTHPGFNLVRPVDHGGKQLFW